jgi:hypothetical protein
MIDNLLLSVGAMKAGTTWLHRQLAGHPGIQFSPEKEIHYFADPSGKSWMSLDNRLARYQQVVGNLQADRLNPNVQRNLAWYAEYWLAHQVGDAWYESLFEKRHLSKSKAAYVADFSNLYSTLDVDAWMHIGNVSRNVKVVYTLRHPSERLWSQFKFSYEFSGRAFELDSIGPADIDTFFANSLTKAVADYASTVERLYACLPSGNVKICFFEAFRSAPLEVLREVEQFLGLDAHSYRKGSLERQINPSQERKPPQHFIVRAEEIRLEQITRLASLGFNLPQEYFLSLGRDY